MGANAPLAPFRSRWSLDFVKKLTIFEVSSTEDGVWVRWPKTVGLRENLLDHLARHVGKPEVSTVGAVGQSLVVDAQ